MPERRRWDIDARFVGVADASAASTDIERLLSMTSVPGWVTEDALDHLGPSCTAAAEMLGIELARMEVVDDVLEIDIPEATREEPRAPRIVAYGLIGSFAESTTHVRETREDGAVVLDVVTGVLPGDSAFATHGHLARVRLLEV
ncbi:MAG TPA: hypothetical protein VK867_02045 [Candidatus Limnocylindrales bacterium]|nr:hypothetical protein [Candidatus Limnocylindrales bacterium]